MYFRRSFVFSLFFIRTTPLILKPYLPKCLEFCKCFSLLQAFGLWVRHIAPLSERLKQAKVLVIG